MGQLANGICSTNIQLAPRIDIDRDRRKDWCDTDHCKLSSIYLQRASYTG